MNKLTDKHIHGLEILREFVISLPDDFEFRYIWMGDRKTIQGHKVKERIDHCIHVGKYSPYEKEIFNIIREWYFSKRKLDKLI
jgi:hypothetical protein